MIKYTYIYVQNFRKNTGKHYKYTKTLGKDTANISRKFLFEPIKSLQCYELPRSVALYI